MSLDTIVSNNLFDSAKLMLIQKRNEKNDLHKLFFLNLRQRGRFENVLNLIVELLSFLWLHYFFYLIY